MIRYVRFQGMTTKTTDQGATVDHFIRVQIAFDWGADEARGVSGGKYDSEGDRLTEIGRFDLRHDLRKAHPRLFESPLTDRLWEEVISSFEEGRAAEGSEGIETLAALQKLIHNTLALPYAWEKVGLGGSPVGPVAAYCRDRSAHLAQVIWSMMESRVDRRVESEPVESERAESERLDLVCRGFGRSCGDSTSGLPKDLFECGWRGNTVNAICPKCRLLARQSVGG